MKILSVHSDFLEFEPKSKALKSAEEADKARKRVDECLVIFTSVEKGDDESIVGSYVDEIEKLSAQVKEKKIVLYPWVHLSSSPSAPDVALDILKKSESALKEKGYDVIRAPFGWYKAFVVSCKGHPLSELSRVIKSSSDAKDVEVIDHEKLLRSISKASLSRDKLKENDHRIIGQNLDLFSFYNVAPGMPFWHPKGLIIRNELISYWREEHRKAGYQEIMTPQIMSDLLWKVSGHWNHYKDNNFSTKYEDRDFLIKPMNCPGGILVFNSRNRSYKELPLRMAELGLVHRVELSGVLSGLFRVVQITQDDAHIYCEEKQMEKEIGAIIDLIDVMYSKFGFTFTMELSTKPDNAMGDPKVWEKAEATLKAVLEKRGAEYKINEGDGAFYGPKIDFHLSDSLGRKWQTATIQLDFQMPERFKIRYIGEDGKEHQPVMVHRTLYGSLERFIGILLEHYNGNLPMWLAPTQVRVLSFNESNAKAAESVAKRLFDAGIRVDTDVSSGTVDAKVRDAEMLKIPCVIVIGDKEVANNTLAVRRRGVKGVKFGVDYDEFEKQLKGEIASRS